ncbi:glycosyltransferase family 1 protein [Bradyrhizobium sp. 199]|uniref:glycosyltransferase family 4 protein n=1 Tax=Bradyrhizobium sp. 199 TaxID=2782664 RepID=UPI001FFA3381|nr:glycosyltransferase family 1 protein [Bradyrhizobium sp. 199]MCK1359003.1 glycosyltransferase family 4 protein [Bradyrhizobium sp. 199]
MPSSEISDLAISAFPLSKGHSTGRGLERVIAELVTGLEAIGQPYTFYDRGIIRSELLAMTQAASFALELRRKRHDLWFAVYPIAGIFPILAAQRPVVTGLYDLIPFLATGYDNAAKYFIKRRCIEFTCLRSDGIIVPFPSTAKQIRELFGVPAERVEVIPLGIDHKTFFPEPQIERRPLHFGFLGEAKRAKGLDTTIIAFSKILPQLPNAHLWIASDGNEIDEMKELARRLIPEPNYKFLGFIPETEIRRFYCGLDLFLFPSRYGFGMSPVEAMACGTPAIVGRTLDSEDFFTQKLSLADPNSPDELAQRIFVLCTERDRYNELRDWGLARVQTLSWENMARHYLAFFKTVKADYAVRQSRAERAPSEA